MFMHVEAEGSRTSPMPGEMWNGGWSSLNPSNGGRLQLVTNLSNCCFCCSVKEEMTSQNILILGWSSLYSPVIDGRRGKEGGRGREREREGVLTYYIFTALYPNYHPTSFVLGGTVCASYNRFVCFFLALPLVYKPLMLRLLKKRERDVKKVHAY